MDRQTDSSTRRQTLSLCYILDVEWINSQTDSSTSRQTALQADSQADGQTVLCYAPDVEWINRQTALQADRQTDGQNAKQAERRTDSETSRQTYFIDYPEGDCLSNSSQMNMTAEN